MGIGNKLNDLLTDRNITVTDLARKIDVAPSTIYSIIQRNNKKVDIDVLIKISKILGVNVEYFSDDNEPVYFDDDYLSEGRKIAKDIEDKILFMDEIGRERIVYTTYTEWNRCHSKSGYINTSAYTTLKTAIIEPIFLSNKSIEYDTIKAKRKELLKMKRKSFKSYISIVEFLWAIGYNKKICIADIISIMVGFKVPSQQLFNHILGFLNGNIVVLDDHTLSYLNAAHERTDIEVTDEMKAEDDAFFDEED